jgi:hypothetical protein
MEFSFFINDNASGYKTNEKWLKKNYPELYQSIINYSSNVELDMNFKEKIWFFYNKLSDRPKCKTCGNSIKFRNRFDKPYGDFCSLSCINNNKEEMIKRQKETFNKKYGIDFYPQHKDFIIKQQETKLKKYGNKNYTNIKKQKKTKLKKYGNSNFNNIEKHKITCIFKYGTDNYSKSNSYQNKINKQFKEKYPNVNILEVSKNGLTIKCDQCFNEYKITKQLLYERYIRNYVTCINCNPIGNSLRSGYELELSDFLKSLGIIHDTSNRTEIKKELDIYIPDKKLAIEINGLYWHNELFVEDNYHLNKTVECNNRGIRLIHIFEDEWLYKKDIVLSIIKNSLGLTEKTIYGRKCVIKEVDSKIAKDFFEKNHIQGNVNSKIRLGLFYNDELVSLMSFSRGRIFMGGKKYEWELNRFSNVLNTNVIGAADKLLQYFIKNYQPEKIVSYSDIRLFDGKMYEKIGFNKISQTKPNYWYINQDLRYHRFKYNKSILIKEGYDKNLTEKEIMFSRKIYRIYDCGNIRWEYVFTNK